MKYVTKYHGEIEVENMKIIHFEKGIPGFPAEKEFTILPLSDDDTFDVLQSLANQQLAFVIANPFHFFKEYDFQLEETSVNELVLHDEKDILVYTILTVQDPFEKTTSNLQAPIIINAKTNKAKQVILTDSIYQTKHPIFHGTFSVSSKG